MSRGATGMALNSGMTLKGTARSRRSRKEQQVPGANEPGATGMELNSGMALKGLRGAGTAARSSRCQEQMSRGPWTWN